MIIELKRFVVTVDSGTLTKACKELFITQPALSISLKRLEEELGIRLFKRIGKKLVLTDQGKSVYQVAIAILKLWNNTKIITQTNIPIKYNIGLFDNAALKLSEYFQKKLTEGELKFDIIIDRSHILSQGLQNGTLDLCISIIQPNYSFNASVILVKKFTEELIPVSGKVWTDDIEKIPFILYNKGSATRNYIDDGFFKHAIKPNVIVESTDPSFMKQLAIGSCGVALLPKNFVQDEINHKKLFVQKYKFKFNREVGIFITKEGSLKQSDFLVQDIIKNF